MARSLTASALRFLRDEDGPTAVEYAVAVALIVLVCVAAIVVIGNNMSDTFTTTGAAAQ